ncbi:MAG: argininosuccinate lyase [Anaerolineaceae bacterium]
MKLWNGRLDGPTDKLLSLLNDSLPVDQRMAVVDVRGSQAWVGALQKAGVLTPAEGAALTKGLDMIRTEFESGVFVFAEGDEDIHTAVERRLTEISGAVGGKLHTGRSRNDQVATDFRLWLAEAAAAMDGKMKTLQAALVSRAESDFEVVLPGYTHLQQAQPVLFSHWWLGHFWALERDRKRLSAVLESALEWMPLGSGALAGTAYPIDRFALAKALGFQEPSPNSLDAVSDRDFAVEFLYWAALTGVHLSRMAEMLIIFSTAEFGYVTLSDEYSTGSSLMPQKKNPDPLELTRSKSGKLTGLLTGLLTSLKGLPSAYDKDLQEDKPAVFEAADTLDLLLPVLAGLIESLTVHTERCRAAIRTEMLATDLADYLVMGGLPFREAHHAVGQVVRQAEKAGCTLMELPLAEWKKVHPVFKDDLFKVFDIEQSLSARDVYGGTGRDAVKEQIIKAKERLA